MIVRRTLVCLGLLAAVAGGMSCRRLLTADYEYEEQMYLSVDGEVSMVVNASLAALVALRGAAIDPLSDVNREAIEQMYVAAGCEVEDVSRGWQSRGRRYVRVRIRADDVRALDRCQLFAWSSYALEPVGEDGLRFRQSVGAPAAGDPGAAGWDGQERVAFTLHAPSRVFHHNVKRLDGTNGTVERGNILTWEQRLTDRRAGVPVEIEVEMGRASILNTTIGLFAGAFGAAVVVLATLIWITVRRGRRRAGHLARSDGGGRRHGGRTP